MDTNITKEQAIKQMTNAVLKAFCSEVTAKAIQSALKNWIQNSGYANDNTCIFHLWDENVDGYLETNEFDFCFGIIDLAHNVCIEDFAIVYNFRPNISDDIYHRAEEDDWTEDDWAIIYENLKSVLSTHLKSMGVPVIKTNKEPYYDGIYFFVALDAIRDNIDSIKDCKNGYDYQAIAKDFIYRINENSNKLTINSEYDNIDEFFSEKYQGNPKLDTMCIIAIDTKEPIIKIEKTKIAEDTRYKFIVDITTEDGEGFSVKCFIDNKSQLDNLIKQTVENLKSYPQFSKYADDLEECL